MSNTPADVLRLVDTLANVQANQRNKQLSLETTNNRIAFKDALGVFHYFSKNDDVNPTDITLTDNIVDAFRVREDTRDYINVDTRNAQAITAFGNTSTNPEHHFLGSGKFGVGRVPSEDVDFYKDIDGTYNFQITNPNVGTSALAHLKIAASGSQLYYRAYSASAAGTLGGVNVADGHLIRSENAATLFISVANDIPMIFVQNNILLAQFKTGGDFELHKAIALHSDGLVDLTTGAVDWATADAAQDSVAGMSRIDVGATAGNNYYSLSGLTEGQPLWIFNTGSDNAYVGAAGSGSENMGISVGACGVCVYFASTGDLYAAT